MYKILKGKSLTVYLLLSTVELLCTACVGGEGGDVSGV